jgi:endonuclease/exonuclease/phosphatase (EEP) superfamily protein YafD
MDRRPATLLLAAATLLLGLPTIVRLVGDRGRTLLVVLDVVVPLLVVPLLLLAVAQLLLKRRRLAVITAVLLALDTAWLVPLYLSDQVLLGEPLTVMTTNLQFGGADPFALVKLVKQHHVDVLATQELTPQAVDLLRGAGLDKELPYTELAPFRDADGCGLWSRYPIDRLPPLQARFQSPGALIKMPRRQVVVRVVHAFPPTTGPVYRGDYAGLTRQVHQLDPLMPTVLAGDFNATADNSLFRRLMGSRYRDASEQAGSGLQATWAPTGWPMLLHLDHVLVDQHFDVRSTQVLDLPGSDHSAVLAHLVVS